jgi:hypothetical protein
MIRSKDEIEEKYYGHVSHAISIHPCSTFLPKEHSPALPTIGPAASCVVVFLVSLLPP